MAFNAATYNPNRSIVHDVDARVKIVLVFAFSLALFFVNTWRGIGLLSLAAVVVAHLARLDVRSLVRMFMPLGVILLFTLLANTFVLNVDLYNANPPTGSVSSAPYSGVPAAPLVGQFGVSPAGFMRGCYFVLRILLLLAASFVLTTTTTSNDINAALVSFMKPLARLGVPTHDIATVVSIALRFIPLTFDEFQQVATAQRARGAALDTGGLVARLRSWVTVLVPLFVGLYRRADSLALAMDARCYGSTQATSLVQTAFTLPSAILLVAGLAACVFVAVVF